MKFVAALALRCVPLERFGLRVLALVLFALCSAAGGARAQESDSSPPAAAIEHYNLGRAHYQAGRYREAVVELEKALALDPNSPNLVYNVARVYELLGDIPRAITYYEQYQRMLPTGQVAERERVGATLMRLRGAMHQVAPASANPPAPEMKRGVADAAFWVTLSTGAAALVAGGISGTFALRASHEAQDFVLGKDGGLAARKRVVERSDRLALAADVLFLSGATFVVTGILLYALRKEPVETDEGRAEIRFGALPGGALLAIGGRL